MTNVLFDEPIGSTSTDHNAMQTPSNKASGISPQAQSADPASNSAQKSGEPNQTSDLRHEQDLDFRLKNCIDQRGRYSFRLGDMSAGFAAGRNVSPAIARRTIEDNFTKQFGLTPQAYLDQHYDERRQMGQDSEREPEPTRRRSRDRGR